MLTPPDLAPETILAMVRNAYGLRATQAAFLPLGADVDAAVYRISIDADGTYFLKLRRAGFDEIAVAVPSYLHAQGISEVMAPIPTTVGARLWASAYGFSWILYPYFEGRDGYEVTLSDGQWGTLGRSLKAVHRTVLPPTLAALVPRERYSPRQWRDTVRAFDAEVATRGYSDPYARGLAEFWVSVRDEIRMMLERTERLGGVLRSRADAADSFVLCHSDLHPGNVLVSANGALTIVDWDNPILAPKERDLMLLDGGVASEWNDPRQDALFFAGYGPTQIDPIALSYYHYERILADLASFGAQIFGAQGGTEDREWGLGMVKGNFLPGQSIELANRMYEQRR
ncbi:MAG TPA: aminoglycoside phosphotransferase family protein [Ktedonobacterales bacterium]